MTHASAVHEPQQPRAVRVHARGNLEGAVSAVHAMTGSSPHSSDSCPFPPMPGPKASGACPNCSRVCRLGQPERSGCARNGALRWFMDKSYTVVYLR